MGSRGIAVRALGIAVRALGIVVRALAISALSVALVTCSNADEPASTDGIGTIPSPIGETGPACELFTAADARAILEGPVELVTDAAADELEAAGLQGRGADACVYRPVDDGSRSAGLLLFPPGAISDEAFDAAVEGAVAIGGPGDVGFEVGGAIVTRVGDVVLVAVATTIEGKAPNPSAGLEIASLAVSRLSGV